MSDKDKLREFAKMFDVPCWCAEIILPELERKYGKRKGVKRLAYQGLFEFVNQEKLPEVEVEK